jgi:hypothetical protein
MDDCDVVSPRTETIAGALVSSAWQRPSEGLNANPNDHQGCE